MTDLEKHRYWNVVLRHREMLGRHPALRAVYAHWGRGIRSQLADVPGINVELGCGCGAMSEHLPGFEHTDLYPHDWVDRVVDAQAMPYDAGSCANLVAVDMLHHLPDAAAFFREVTRVLAPAGRLVLLEPLVTPYSYLVYKLFHHEPVDMSADPFGPVSTVDPESGEACNTAIPTLVFGRGRKAFERRFVGLRIAGFRRLDAVVYPLTGGFSRATRVPAAWVDRLMSVEDRLTKWMGRLVALRMQVTLEKTR